MPLFFIIAAAMGALTLGAVATNPNKMMGYQRTQALTVDGTNVDSTNYAITADCLTAASAQGSALSACDKSK
jgi:hypothetical protein